MSSRSGGVGGDHSRQSWLRSALSGGRQQQQPPAPAASDVELPVRTDSGGASQPRAVAPAAARPPSGLDVGGGSSGAGLPSALATPGKTRAAGHCCSSYQDDPADGAGSCGASDSGDDDAGAGAAGNAGSESGDDDAGAAAAAASAGAGGAAAAPPGAARAELPPSGNSQLDDYLKYLLRGAHTHKSLWFCDWGCSEEACAALGEFLRRDRRIRVAALSGNSISDEGAELLAEGLRWNSSLASLDLSQNDIGDDGALALAEALASGRCVLAELNLAGNKRLSDEGAEALAAAAASSSTLRKVGLGGTLVSAAQLQVVAHVLTTREYTLPSEPQAVPAAAGGATAAAAASGSSRRWPHMRKPSSQLFDIELTEAELPRSLSSSSHTPASSRQRHTGDLLHLPPAIAVQALTAHTDPLEASVAAQVEQAVLELGREQQQQQQQQQQLHQQDQELLLQLALRLAARGYSVVLRTCCPALDGATATRKSAELQHNHTQQQHQQQQHHHQQQQHQRSSRSSFGGEGLRHTTLRVSQPAAAQTAAALLTCIVDPAFTPQWLMPQPSARYLGVLAALPPVLCLPEARLWQLLQRLSREMETAFADRRLSMPPWRAAAVMRDKWLGLAYVDVPVAEDASVDALATQLAQASLSAHHQQQQQHL